MTPQLGNAIMATNTPDMHRKTGAKNEMRKPKESPTLKPTAGNSQSSLSELQLVEERRFAGSVQAKHQHAARSERNEERQKSSHSMEKTI